MLSERNIPVLSSEKKGFFVIAQNDGFLIF
jgi:hypothetical protein